MRQEWVRCSCSLPSSVLCLRAANGLMCRFVHSDHLFSCVWWIYPILQQLQSRKRHRAMSQVQLIIAIRMLSSLVSCHYAQVDLGADATFNSSVKSPTLPRHSPSSHITDLSCGLRLPCSRSPTSSEWSSHSKLIHISLNRRRRMMKVVLFFLVHTLSWSGRILHS